MKYVKWQFIGFVVAILLLSVASVGAQDTTYTIPEDPADMDASTVIATVGDTEITLGQFRERVRYERWRFLNTINRVVEESGPQVLDIQDQSNPFLPALQNVAALMADEENFGALVYQFMIADAVYHDEILARDLDISVCDVDAQWATVLFVNEVDECDFGDDFNMLRAAYLTDATTFTGASPEVITQILVGQAEREIVRSAVGATFEAPPVTLVQTRHIRVPSPDVAQEALDRINAGEDFVDVMLDLTIDSGVRGNGGNLGFFSAGQMVPEFEDAVFNAEINEFVGPVETQFGFHVIEVLDRAPQVRARQIVTRTLDDANRALERIDAGETFADVAREMSIDRSSAGRSGDMGFVIQGQGDPALEEFLFSAEPGVLSDPIQTEQGFHILEVMLRDEDDVAVSARHILVETEEEANDVLAQLEAGADFETLANEVSIDPTAAGNGGDTLTILTAGQETGFYESGRLPSDMDEAIFNAEIGDVVGPFGTQVGFFVVQVVAQDSRPPNIQEVADAQDEFVDMWEAERFQADDIERTDLWRGFVPTDPLPTDVSEQLLPFETLLMLFDQQP
ncbi:MAG: hypothetical protein D6737_05335 [Chloroflexi bacterium]|nr:MAG: hypothetical protein D6737_05335 [Chloroflexota bacterium]